MTLRFPVAPPSHPCLPPHHSLREVGSTCVSTTIKQDGVAGAGVRSYNVILLKDPSKTLAETFPNIKIGPKKK